MLNLKRILGTSIVTLGLLAAGLVNANAAEKNQELRFVVPKRH
jgi:hypothetical protein